MSNTTDKAVVNEADIKTGADKTSEDPVCEMLVVDPHISDFLISSLIVTNSLSNYSEDLDVIVTEIKAIEKLEQLFRLLADIEIGRRLVAAKKIVNHGKWGNWLKENFSYSQRTANYLMLLNKKFGSLLHMFGANSHTCANLPPSKAIKMLSVPDNEIEAFLKRNDVLNMTVLEVEAVVKEEYPLKAKATKNETPIKAGNDKLLRTISDADTYNTSPCALPTVIDEVVQTTKLTGYDWVREFQRLSNSALGIIAEMVRRLSSVPNEKKSDIRCVMIDTAKSISEKIEEIMP